MEINQWSLNFFKLNSNKYKFGIKVVIEGPKKERLML